jgi:hypothetical protein
MSERSTEFREGQLVMPSRGRERCHFHNGALKLAGQAKRYRNRDDQNEKFCHFFPFHLWRSRS